jgi:hypothetical protein
LSIKNRADLDVYLVPGDGLEDKELTSMSTLP